MTNKWEDIPMPSEAEKAAARKNILDAGLMRPMTFKDLIRSVPPWVLFFGVTDCLFLSLVIFGLCLIPAAVMAVGTYSIAPLLFLLSPVLYGTLQITTLWKEKQEGTWQWKVACPISFSMLTALRMLAFGGICIIVCVPANLLLWSLSGRQYGLLWMLGLSFSSLFLYGLLSIAIQKHFRRQKLMAAPVIWMLFGIFLLSCPSTVRFLEHVPAMVFFLIALACLACDLAGLKGQMSKILKKEADPYALC